MKQYLDLLKNILENGHRRPDRTGHGRISLYGGPQLRFNMDDGFPLISTRYVNWHIPIAEMLWFITGSTQTKDLGYKIWDKWAPTSKDVDDFIERVLTDAHLRELLGIVNSNTLSRESVKWLVGAYLGWSDTEASNRIGDIGPIYGKSFRHATSYFLPIITQTSDIAEDILAAVKDEVTAVTKYEPGGDMSEEDLDALVETEISKLSLSRDQIFELVKSLREDPWSSRHVVVNWSTEHLPIAELSPQENVLAGLPSLAPCQLMFQCHVIPGEVKGLSLQLYMRSSDAAVGLPYNIAQYAALLHMLAKELDYKPCELIVDLGDVHIYPHHVDGVRVQLERSTEPLPTLHVTKAASIFRYTLDNFQLEGYNPATHIPFEVAV